MEQDEKQGDSEAFFGKAILVMVCLALDETMGFHLSEVIAKLIQGVGFWAEVKLFEESLMQITGFPGGTGP